MISLNHAQLRAIDRAKEGLVEAAERLLGDTAIQAIDASDLGDSQFRNLLAVAMETESPKVVMNFIRYQMGRDKAGRSWRKQCPGGTLGQRLIDALTKDGNAIADALEGMPDVKNDPELEQLARIVLIRHFLGFASRYRKYTESTKPPAQVSRGDRS